MEKKKDFRNGLMVALVVAIVVMSVGYAALSQRLTVNATATVGDAKWKVRITDIAFDSAKSSVTTDATTQSLNPEEQVEGEGSTGAKFNVTLAKPGDKAVYNITVSNLGTIDAELDQITDLVALNAENPTDIIYTVTEDNTNSSILAPNGTHKYTVTVEWKSDSVAIPEVTEKATTIYFDYQQA